MSKKLLFTGIAVSLLTLAYSKELSVNNGKVSESHPIVGLFPFSHPLIESILHNPSVYKKQVSRHLVQATGYREGVRRHFIIHFRKKQLHGAWQTFYANNQLCDSGTLERNIPNGEWKTWYPNGGLKTVRHYSAEKYHYTKADLQNNHPKHQRYALTRYAGLHKNTARYFQPAYPDHSNIGSDVSILQKIQHNTDGNGSSYMAPFTNCLHHGVYINYYENGAVKDSGYYANGLKHGLWKESLAEEGTYAFGFYNNGLRNGQWKYYNRFDRLLYTEEYNRNGKVHRWHHFKSNSKF